MWSEKNTASNIGRTEVAMDIGQGETMLPSQRDGADA